VLDVLANGKLFAWQLTILPSKFRIHLTQSKKKVPSRLFVSFDVVSLPD
jgi:hypothetical protein